MRGGGQNGKQDSPSSFPVHCTVLLNTYDFIILLVAIKLAEAVRMCWFVTNLQHNLKWCDFKLLNEILFIN